MGNAESAETGLDREEGKRLSELTHFTQEEIHRWFVRFDLLDKDRTGSVGAPYLLAIPDFKGNKFLPLIFRAMDEENVGKLTFERFVRALSAVSSRAPVEERKRFVFKVYDLDRDGQLSATELMSVFHILTSNSIHEGTLKSMCENTIASLDSDGDGLITYDEFKVLIGEADMDDKFTRDYLPTN